MNVKEKAGRKTPETKPFVQVVRDVLKAAGYHENEIRGEMAIARMQIKDSQMRNFEANTAKNDLGFMGSLIAMYQKERELLVQGDDKTALAEFDARGTAEEQAEAVAEQMYNLSLKKFETELDEKLSVLS